MYSKIIAIILQTCLIVKVMTPPNSNPIKNILSRKSIKGIFVSDIFPNIVIVLILIQTSLYLYVMCQQGIGSIPILPDENHKFSEWQLMEIFCHLCNIYFLRSWCFDTLKEYFTFDVTIKKDHKLITTGPYSLLVHPSYTGAILKYILVLQMNFQLCRYIPVYFPSTMGNILSSLWFKAFQVICLIIVLRNRVIYEEKVLKSHFGKEWDVYFRQRKRFLPYVF